MDSICPYLQAVGESAAPSGLWPSHRYRCIAGEQTRMIAPRAQVVFCLTEQHPDCPLYPTDAGLPAEPEALTEMLPDSEPSPLPG